MAVTFLVQVPTVKLAATCRAQGYTGAFAILAVSDQNFDKLPAPTYGVDLDFPWWSTAKPVVQYRNVMAQYAPGVDYQGYHQTNMWSLLTLFSYAMDKSGPAASASASGADVISAYRTAVKNVTLDGLLPQPITYSQSGNTVVNCFWPVDHLADGSYKTLAGSGASGNGATGDLASTCVS